MSNAAKFVEGSLMRHIIVMSSTSAVGLVSIFLVDLLDMWFISLLGDSRLVAAIGFCLLYTSPSPRDRQKSRMPSSA